jgi:L-ribulose-5-phosphate 3-epimerase
MKKSGNKFTRREFLGTMALAGAAIPLTGLSSGKPVIAPTASLRPIHIFSKPLQWLGYDALAMLVAEAGAEGIDLSVRPGGHVLPENVESDLPKAVEAASKNGLKIDMIVTGIKGADEKYAESIIRTASSLGVKYYRLGEINYEESTGIMETLHKVNTDFRKLAALNSKYKIHGAFQNHSGTRVGASVWDIYEILKDLDPAFIGCQYDIRHAVVEGGISWVNGFKLVSPWIRCTDIKDFKWSQTNGKWAPESLPVGEGMVNFDDYFKLVKKYNVSGPMSIHYEYPPFERSKQEITEPEKRKLFLTAMRKDIDKVKVYREKYQL